MTTSESPDSETLTAEDRARYARDGYLMVRKLFEPAELDAFVQRFLAIVEEEVEPGPGMTIMKDVMVVRGKVDPRSPAEAIAKVQDYESDPVLFDQYAKSPKLLDHVEAFTGPDIKSIHTMLINKPPNVDGRHPLHQDLLYFPFRPADSIVATWTALEPCTRENGCLVVVPESHKGGLLEHENPEWDDLNLYYFGARTADAETERTHLEMDPGDTVFFHPLLLHGSGRNRTDGFRRAISAHYASAGCQFVPGGSPAGRGRPYTLVRGRGHEGCI